MKQIDKFLAISYLLIFSIISVGLIIFNESYVDKVIYLIIVFIWILLLKRSFHLENYLRRIDSKEKLTFFEHFVGVLNNWNKLVGLVVIAKPVLENNMFKKERQLINLLTVGIYLTVSLMIVIIIKFT